MHNARSAPRHRKEANARKYAVHASRAAATLGAATLLTISGMTLAQAATETTLNTQQPGTALRVLAAATDIQAALDIDPIVPPIDSPVDPPVVPPVDPPVVPPVDPPVVPPVDPPVVPPVDPPVVPPVDPPVVPPVDPPVDPPVEVPGSPAAGSPAAPQPAAPLGNGSAAGTVTPHQALPGTVPLAAAGPAAVTTVDAAAGQPAKRITVPAGEAVQLQSEGSTALQVGGGVLVAGAAGALALRFRPRRNNA